MTQAKLDSTAARFNETAVHYPKQLCLHQLFERQALRTPEETAVVFGEETLTYSELNRRAGRLARRLRELRVGPEVLVGVYMERSIEMVVALYGILKAGGAYVPLEPEFPWDRIAFMLEDTRVPVLLTQERFRDRLPPHHAGVVYLDSGWPDIDGTEAGDLAGGLTPENLAYVIYTSGSTGRPKGAMNHHRGICNRILWMQDAYQLIPADRVLQKTPFSFDVSVWEFFWPLAFGARFVVARPGGHRDSSYLVDTIVEHGITTIHFVPSMLRLFVEDARVDRCRSLKRVICSGEALSRELQERFFSRLNAELHNLYGPTEAAVDVTHFACRRGDTLGFVPIGRPVANTRIHILDERMEPVGIGETGELHIGGVQVGRGYLNRPDLTAEKFIPDPFSSEPGARLYKTGDLAAYLPDGDIKYLGRIDCQVKIGGNRIEPGEIESVLEAHPAVKQAAVLAREDGEGEKRLVAYIVLRPGGQPEPAALRRHLNEKLPPYMLPSAFVTLEAMPLLPNGKIDRRALPGGPVVRPELTNAYAPPRNTLERHLAEIWTDILGLDRVGIHDRFFELGGTSLQAARFINTLQREMGENIYLVSIFESPTIAQYAEFLRREYAHSVARTLAPGSGREPEHAALPRIETEKIDENSVARFRECIYPVSESAVSSGRKNPPVLFILAPPRSGTTLMRVMLAGHPALFAASELQLLGFSTLRERRAAFTGKYSLWLEGTIRAIMELRKCGAEEAAQLMEEYERLDYTTLQFYRLLHEWAGGRMVVDKSPAYALDRKTLERAERDFDRPLYIHLVRHPYDTVRSFESYHMDQVIYLKAQPFTPRRLGELVWLVSHGNVQQFLRYIPAERRFFLRFEDLVQKPQLVAEELCRTLGLPFHPDLLKPYEKLEHKMVDGIHPESKPMGDTKFLEYKGIDPAAAGKWREGDSEDFLSGLTLELAGSFGYSMPDSAHVRKELLERNRLRRMQARIS